jgi:hypothetical protein
VAIATTRLSPRSRRLFSAAEATWQRMGALRFKIYETSVAALRDALGEKDFDAVWA